MLKERYQVTSAIQRKACPVLVQMLCYQVLSEGTKEEETNITNYLTQL